MRPFPAKEIAEALQGVKAAAVLEKDISFGAEGTVFTNVNSALKKFGLTLPVFNYIGGLGGKDISTDEIQGIFEDLERITSGGVAGVSPAERVGENAEGIGAEGETSPSYIKFLGIPQQEQILGGKK